MHLHLGDLFEVSTDPIYSAVANGVTMGLSPGAGSGLSTMLSVEELIKLYKGELEEEVASSKMTRNAITNTTAPLVVGIKDHMGHFIMSEKVSRTSL